MSEDQRNKLDVIEIPVPCPMLWEDMDGDERKKFCQKCDKHVHNLSDMSSKEAEEILDNSNGKLCVSFVRNDDGTIKTDECPRVLRPLRSIWLKAASVAIGALVALYAGVPALAKKVQPPERTRGQVVMPPQAELGNVAMPAPAKTSPPVGDKASTTPVREIGKLMAPVNHAGTAGSGVIHLTASAENIPLKFAQLTDNHKFLGGARWYHNFVTLEPVLSVKYAGSGSDSPNKTKIWSNWAMRISRRLNWQTGGAAGWHGAQEYPVVLSVLPHRRLLVVENPAPAGKSGQPRASAKYIEVVNYILNAADNDECFGFPADVGDVQEVILRMTFKQIEGEAAAKGVR